MQTSERVRDKNGWYEVRKNPLSKVGVFPYLGKYISDCPDPTRIYNVLRPAEELSHPAFLQSIRLLPWIDGHVMLGEEDVEKGVIPAEQKGVHGVIGENVCFEGDTVYGNIKLFSSSLADAVELGKNELSLGYRCQYEYKPGVWRGENYDYIQRNIRGNHVASVEDGRMGSEVAVLDSFTFTFDAKDIEIMDETTEVPPGMSLEELLAALKANAPMLAEVQKLMASMSGPAVVEGAPIVDPEVIDADDTPAAAAVTKVGDEETEEEKKAREAAAAAGTGADEETPAEKDAVKKEDAAMDAAIRRHVSPLLKKIARLEAANNPTRMLNHITQRDRLATALAPHVGVFDASDKTFGQVVAYGVEKLGIKAAPGKESDTLLGYLQAKPAPTAGKMAHGFDHADSGTKKASFGARASAAATTPKV